MNIKLVAFIPLSFFIASCQTIGLDRYFDNEKRVIDHNSKYKQLRWECNNGEITSCNELGQLIYSNTNNHEKYVDRQKKIEYPHTARPYLEKACKVGVQNDDANLATSCAFLAEVDLQLNSNYDDYIRYYDQSCNVGIGTSCHQLGWIYEKGPEIDSSLKKDLQRAGEYYDRACLITGDYADYDKNLACSKRAIMSLKGDYSRKLFGQEYIDALSSSCSKDEGQSCYAMGEIYEKGIFSDELKIYENINKAYDYYSKGCATQNEKSCKSAIRIINMYKNGSEERNIHKNVNRAYEMTKDLCRENKQLDVCKDI